MKIRESTSQDHSFIRKAHKNAFGQSAGAIVSQLAIDLLIDKTALPILSLVAEINNKIVGNIIFSTVKIEGCKDNISAYILAPLAVIKEYQGKGIGQSLIKHGLGILQAQGTELVFVLGVPDYYSRTGFEPATRYILNSPYELDYPEAWMALEIKPGALNKAEGVVSCASSLDSPE